MEWNEAIYSEADGARGRTGVLVLHGFGGSPRSLQELAGRLVDAGYTVALPLLTGHGLTPESMERSLWTEWTADAERALVWLKERTDEVFLCGLSMGGTLALWLAERHPEAAGLVSLNTIIQHPLEPVMHVLGRLGFPRWMKAIGNDAKLEGVDERAYDRIPTRSYLQLARLLSAVRKDLALVRCPALLFSSVVDHVVPRRNQHEIYTRIASKDKEMVELHDSYHLISMDNDKELVFEKTLEFIAEHLGAESIEPSSSVAAAD